MSIIDVLERYIASAAPHLIL